MKQEHTQTCIEPCSDNGNYLSETEKPVVSGSEWLDALNVAPPG